MTKEHVPRRKKSARYWRRHEEETMRHVASFGAEQQRQVFNLLVNDEEAFNEMTAEPVCYICGYPFDGATRIIDGETVCADDYSCIKRSNENIRAALKDFEDEQ